MNSDLLEESCAQIQAHGLPNRSINSYSHNCLFTHSDFIIPGSNIHFVQGIPNNLPNTCRTRKQDSDGESIVSASSEELEHSNPEEAQNIEEPSDEFGIDLCHLFNPEVSRKVGKTEEFSCHSLDQKAIPQNLS